MTSTALFAAVTLCLVGSTSAQSWTGNYYRMRFEQDPGAANYTIHGLWPEWEAAAKGFCRNVTFNETAIKDLEPQMNIVWPSDQGPNTDFWTHEWQKHGSCADNMDEHTYFSTALKLYDQYHTQCPHAQTGNECNFCFLRNLTQTCECTNDGPGDCPGN